MKILADQNMPLVEEFFSDLGEVRRFDGRNLQASTLQAVDALLVRSVTTVNEELLAQAQHLKFVGTATIGIDHVDTAHLAQRNIAFSSAPGCNAIAVAEYVISALYAYTQETGTSLEGRTLGIVGVGNIGKCLQQKLINLGLRLLLCDPVRHEAGTLDEHVDIDSVLAQADIVTFHVPLVKEGRHQTRHLLDAERISKLKDNMLVINASRGDVIDNQALLSALQKGKRLELVLDVWENEPNILTELLPYVRFASVHIAGHTQEGKARGTQMLYQGLCQRLGISVDKSLEDFLPVPALTKCRTEKSLTEHDLGRLVHLVYDIRRDDGLMRANLASHGFDSLRKTYPPRREFSTLSIENMSEHGGLLTSLGFNVIQKNED
ncbi:MULTISPECIES: 4-phosphoerythronate dehydrogenase [Pseudoalteromonas]|uniref:Erythronate-4-phosphate dehydrogenase n=1 Tax=Pseudoalteromonas amylolytica TaxID=1859457 RepID=A0A1S1MRR8_9GAMM|nr:MULTISPECIES: 4-phosphoerythronate dehydrogenase [Pseudoalteromonas]MCF6436374.1 4-phosphoerythronate dehydrogenase [Pseudoalteromonas sp. MMG022]OHU86705.1 erythronate-4-phosphate dehydrogenase [Pseudoalteromonas sp. JW3]OHU88771.1 erythronate-4-phosphate dehydrogenase [Pseudoalteromonas amylolytica]